MVDLGDESVFEPEDASRNILERYKRPPFRSADANHNMAVSVRLHFAVPV